MKTVLVNVLSSSVEPYPMLESASRATWASVAVSGVDVAFFGNNPNGCLEGLYNMGRKCLAAYDALLSNLKWDFMARVNSSCYVSQRRLIDFVQPLPAENLFMGVGTKDAHGREYLWGGMQYIISRDVVQKLVDNAAKWNHGEMEDVAMSLLVKELGIPFNYGGWGCSINRRPNDWLCISYGMAGFDFKTFEEFAEKNVNHFIRVKQDGNRHEDVRIMHELHRLNV